MKQLFEKWYGYLKEGDDENGEPEEEWLKIWQNTLRDLVVGDQLFQEAPKKPKPRTRTPQKIMPFKSDEESVFCLWNPKINDFARKNADNLAETILFVFGTMQTPWPKFVPYFRFVVDAIKQGEDILEYAQSPSNPGTWTKWSQKNPNKSLDDWRGEKGVYNQKREVNHNRRLQIVRNVYLQANGIDEKELSDEQMDYINKAVGATSYMVSTPGTNLWTPIWEAREGIYNTMAPIIDKVRSWRPYCFIRSLY